MISFVTVLVSTLIFTSIPSLAAPVGSRDLHVRSMRGQVDAVVARDEQPIARAIALALPARDEPAPRAVTIDTPAASNVERDASEPPRRRRHARDLLRAREIPDVPARRSIVFAREDVAPRSHQISKEAPAKRDVVLEAEVKRETIPVPAEVKRDVVPATEVKRDAAPEVKRSTVIPTQASKPRARSAKFAALAPVTKREPIRLISAFQREIEKLD